MPDRSTQRTINEFEALLEMVEQDGATPAGELPPAEHIAALRSNSDLHGPAKVAEAHANGNPPDHAGGQS